MSRTRLPALAVALILALAPALAAAQSVQKLFRIERSKNKNEVHYDARLVDGQLHPKEPVVAYWALADGGRSPLSWLERKKAYGFDIAKDKSGDFWTMTIVPAKDRPIKVYVRDGKARAEIRIGGHQAFLTRLYINTTEGTILPTVNYIDLIGVDAATGAPRTERIVPK